MAIVLILKSLMMFLSQQLLLVVLVSAEELKCPSSFDCGYLGQIKFPFTTTLQPHCGLLAIDGCQQNDSYASITLQLNNPTPTSYSVLQVEPRTIIITDDRQYHYLQTKNCTAFANNFSLPQTSSLASFYLKYNITIFRCNRSLNTTPPQHFYKYSNCSDYDIFYGPPNTQIPPGFKWPSSLTPCSTVQLAVEANSTNNPFQFLSASIAIEVRLSDTCESCLNRGEGQCLIDSRGNFYCTKENKSLAWKLGLGIGLPAIIIIGLLISIWYCKPRCLSYFYSNPNQESASIYFGVPVFTYKDLEKATKRFDRSRELGEGGFGIVYYGKLDDGREVAVKRLHEHSYRRLEQFMNEIKILTRLRHQNLVSLYGCTSRHSRELVLVYEYISNGTVASHLHHHGSTNRAFLPWPIRIKVAVETATALAYLHSSDIIHRDVKTNNILLDSTYCVKVADFGLSRLFPNDVTHVSTAPQGTPGYVDPEYHRCYQLTNKSDVYSFGVVLIELISSMPVIDLSRHNDEINLADLAIRKIQKGEIAQLVDPSLSFDSNSDVKSQITSVAELAFQCLQRDRELRPSMDEILEVLRRIESWKDESGHLKELNFQRSDPLSPDHVEMKLLRNMKMISSPKAVTDKWNSDSTSPIVSGQSPNKI